MTEATRAAVKTATLLRVQGLTKYFPIKQGLLQKTVGYVRAVENVSFTIRHRETLGLVGESGCGKTTIGRCIMRLVEPTAGEVYFRTKRGVEVNLVGASRDTMKEIYRDMQMIFQDPFSSLNPRMPISEIMEEPLEIQGIGSKEERRERVRFLIERVGLNRSHLDRYPHELSGGQRQRIGVARALTVDPHLLICDEPVSALDVSVQAQILNLLKGLQKELGLSYLFISHDLSVVEHVSDRIMVMYLGRIMELAPTDKLFLSPNHPYTEALLWSIPIPGSHTLKPPPLQGGTPNPANPPSGCAFHPRCKYAVKRCSEEIPELVEVVPGSGHMVRCHRYAELELAGFEELRSGSAGQL